MITLDSILAQAATRVDSFSRTAADIPYERKGVLYSEMLFLRAALGDSPPPRLVESGRARGQSTHLLAACLPGTQILSVEHDPNSPDVPVAAARLAPFANVKLLFGDSMVVVPELVQPGDAVLIDGPKGYRALRLAFDVLARCRPGVVFIHDCGLGSEERTFLDRHVPGTLYSDARAYVDRYAFLDEPCRAVHPDAARVQREAGRSYGPTVACLPYDPQRDYASLRRRSRMSALSDRVANGIRRRFGSPGHASSG
ncbi:class I SAM-dependent methyltransferase [Ramlibacter sp. PS3R-8]|uniref:class I SAM-dependent methyltransferase n=1 Tax=Ramlibacter sp. PS3R-8 TaxID=3133437 RepID=UPI0030B7401A